MKKVLTVIFLVGQSMLCLADPTIPTSLEKSVQHTYPNAEHKTWYQLEDGYKVYFDCGVVKNTIEYDQQGHMRKALRYYGLETLPPLIAEKLYEKWPNRNVYGVTELCTSEGIQYTIVLQDEQHWYTIESDADGDMSQKQKMVKR
jgi:hypothetical protein